MMALVVAVLILAGALFCLVAALGILRMPDLLMRMHAATKAGTLGAGLMLLAAAFALGDMGAAVRAGAAIVFLLLTAPVAAHLIGRAAYRSGQLRLWKGTQVDEWGRRPQATLRLAPRAWGRIRRNLRRSGRLWMPRP